MHSITKPFFAVVLLHGLGAPQNELAVIANKLRATFGNAVLIIQPSCRVRQRSVYLTTQKQAEKVLAYIQDKFIQYQTSKTLPVVLIGYSHGGVVAMLLGERYSDNLNINGIIAINAPLKGVALLKRNPKEIKEFMSEAKASFQCIGYQSSWLYKTVVVNGMVSLLLPYLQPSFRFTFPFCGLKDLHPESSCIETVGNFLHNGAYGIPILIIASYQDDFRKLFDIRQPIEQYTETMIQLNQIYSRYITGNHFQKHDTLLSLSSQLCRNYVTEYAIHDSSDGPNNTAMAPYTINCTNIKSKIYQDLIHAHNLIAINPFLFVAYGERVIHAHQVLTDLISFIKECTCLPV
ncbi:esterase/lipase family protein [Candidatus Cardinium hertigii]|jgi:pimeloyl-ACP methyl ester carboxylesterase|uniref:Alpha/beta hydrolase n=1 Tax=Candidatus Cardinium hertigii TaxID=247481 RepID=A0A3N2QB46_9BACT|nr:alpha/beta hydrolase [Candidatus Cardinium hertigii]ROT47023.1 alpha/beta hydrolase [Candidatus Cardinium hertigii]